MQYNSSNLVEAHTFEENDSANYDWQMQGEKLPVRKKMLAFTLRRLARKQMNVSVTKIREFARVVGQEWLELKEYGQENFMAEIDEEQVAK